MSSGARAHEAWRSYTSTGALRPDLLRPAIYRSWQRAHREHVNPRRIQPEVRTGLELQRAIERHFAFLEVARPYADAVSRAAQGVQHAVGIAAPDGTLLYEMGDERSLNEPGVLPPLGSMLDEAHAGPNGIGTPLAEGTQAEVYGAEHFVQDLQIHACYGVPIRGEAQETIGALCLAVRLPGQVVCHQRQLLEVASRGISAGLCAAAMRQRLRELSREGAPKSELLKAVHQDTVQGHAAALMQFELAADNPGDERSKRMAAEAAESFARHNRHARTWRLASGLLETESPMTIDEVVLSASELLQTEARLLRVKLSLEGTTACGQGWIANPRLALRVLAETADALRRVGNHGEVLMALHESGWLRWRSHSSDHTLEIERKMRVA